MQLRGHTDMLSPMCNLHATLKVAKSWCGVIFYHSCFSHLFTYAIVISSLFEIVTNIIIFNLNKEEYLITNQSYAIFFLQSRLNVYVLCDIQKQNKLN